jgi:hypothetical protein
MLEEERQKRQGRTESQIGVLAYERYQLACEIDACQKRIAEIDRLLAEKAGALRENEAVRRDIATEAAIAAATKDNEKELDNA